MAEQTSDPPVVREGFKNNREQVNIGDVMRDMESVQYIDIADMVKMIDEGNIVVIDVRGEDRWGGHIKGSINIDDLTFLHECEDLVKKYAKEEITICVHCMESRMRGPSCARQFARKVREVPGWKAKTVIMKNGFEEFVNRCKADPKLMEKYMEDFKDVIWQQKDGRWEYQY